MRFCLRVGLSPAEYDEQPADRVLEWMGYLSAEADAKELKGPGARRMDG